MVWYKNVFSKKNKKSKILVIDFDDTIAVDENPNIGSPMPGVKEALIALKQAGYEIVIYSCRTTGKSPEAIQQETAKMGQWFIEQGIPYDRIDEGRNGKPYADFNIDNKNLHYGGGDDWEKLTAFLLSQVQ